MPDKRICCHKIGCNREKRSGWQGCGGRQYIQPEYIEYCKHMLKSGAKVGDWICTECRNELRLAAATKGIDMNAEVRRRLLRALCVTNDFIECQSQVHVKRRHRKRQKRDPDNQEFNNTAVRTLMQRRCEH